ncbi:uncharacterized protein LOC120205277 [Hibiscus syriacus]|uniref:uncharacterized protein LOC120205277 n=1 Tax=Hibiscus syriacus TaxID=106335 RepID=UPI001920E9FF|nr:uncharacterized protein LOC120205277 [Hibiscus syriacus]
MFLYARKLARDIKLAYTSTHRVITKDPKWIKLRKTPRGTWILNTDGAYKAVTGLVSARELIRDENGEWVRGFMLRVGHIDSTTPELWDARQGLLLAKSLGVINPILEMDGKWVIDTSKGRQAEG